MFSESPEAAINRFAKYLGSEIRTEKVHGVSVLVEYFYFNDDEGISYEFKLARPVTEYGSKMVLRSKKKGQDLHIKCHSRAFLKPKVVFKSGNVSEPTRIKLEQLRNTIGSFEWKTNDQYIFSTRSDRYDFETLKLIREIHLELTS